jgi:hypothetical protein
VEADATGAESLDGVEIEADVDMVEILPDM